MDRPASDEQTARKYQKYAVLPYHISDCYAGKCPIYAGFCGIENFAGNSDRYACAAYQVHGILYLTAEKINRAADQYREHGAENGENTMNNTKNTNTANDARRVSIYTHDGKHLHGRVFCAGLNYFKRGAEERFAAVRYALSLGSIERLSRHANFNAIADATGDAFGTWRGVRPVKHNKNNKERARKPKLYGATDAALACASLVIKNAYRTQGLKGKTLEKISDAINAGDIAKYRKLTAATSSGAGAERGLYMVSCAVARAYGVMRRTDGIADAETRTRLLYDALASDTSGAAGEMFGDAYAALLETRGHTGKALLYGAHLHAGQNAAQKVLYAARTKRTRNAVSVEDWTRTDLADAAVSVPTAWDVYTYEDLEYMLSERAAIIAQAEKDNNRYAARWVTYKLGGLTQVDIAAKLHVSLSTVEKTAAYVRRVFNQIHGTAYGAAHARAREK